MCVQQHPECKGLSQECGGPGQLTQSCCGNSKCVASGNNGKMFCEAWVGDEKPVQARASKDMNASTLAACPGCRQCAADSEECSDELHCCDANSRCESRLGGSGAVCVKQHPQCAAESEECSEEIPCCDAHSRCESRLGGSGAMCVQQHPECKGLSQECGGPGQLTQSCCGNSKCVASGNNGKMFCEAWVGDEKPVQARASKDMNASTLAACPGCRQCAADSEECSDELHCCDANSRCESRLGGSGAVCVKQHPQCAAESDECSEEIPCCDAQSRCESRLGGSGAMCVKQHPECKGLSQECGGPGQLTQSCCGNAKCVASGDNGKMFCEAWVR